MIIHILASIFTLPGIVCELRVQLTILYRLYSDIQDIASSALPSNIDLWLQLGCSRQGFLRVFLCGAIITCNMCNIQLQLTTQYKRYLNIPIKLLQLAMLRSAFGDYDHLSISWLYMIFCWDKLFLTTHVFSLHNIAIRAWGSQRLNAYINHE